MNTLPPRCYAQHPSTGKVIGIERGKRGYYPVETRVTADQLNAVLNVTPAQREAMLAGSAFGWHVPAADPARYDARGILKPSDSEE